MRPDSTHEPLAVDDGAVAPERQLDIGARAAEVRDLGEHLEARVVERVAPYGKCRDREIIAGFADRHRKRRAAPREDSGTGSAPAHQARRRSRRRSPRAVARATRHSRARAHGRDRRVYRLPPRDRWRRADPLGSSLMRRERHGHGAHRDDRARGRCRRARARKLRAALFAASRRVGFSSVACIEALASIRSTTLLAGAEAALVEGAGRRARARAGPRSATSWSASDSQRRSFENRRLASRSPSTPVPKRRERDGDRGGAAASRCRAPP